MHDKSTLIYDRGHTLCICQLLTRQTIEYPSQKL